MIEALRPSHESHDSVEHEVPPILLDLVLYSHAKPREIMAGSSNEAKDDFLKKLSWVTVKDKSGVERQCARAESRSARGMAKDLAAARALITANGAVVWEGDTEEADEVMRSMLRSWNTPAGVVAREIGYDNWPVIAALSDGVPAVFENHVVREQEMVEWQERRKTDQHYRPNDFEPLTSALVTVSGWGEQTRSFSVTVGDRAYAYEAHGYPKEEKLDGELKHTADTLRAAEEKSVEATTWTIRDDSFEKSREFTQNRRHCEMIREIVERFPRIPADTALVRSRVDYDREQEEQRGAVLHDFGFRAQRGQGKTYENCWVVGPDGTLREADRGTWWDVVYKPELALRWQKGDSRSPHRFISEHVPPGGITAAQRRTMEQLLETIEDEWKGRDPSSDLPTVGNGWIDPATGLSLTEDFRTAWQVERNTWLQGHTQTPQAVSEIRGMQADTRVIVYDEPATVVSVDVANQMITIRYEDGKEEEVDANDVRPAKARVGKR